MGGVAMGGTLDSHDMIPSSHQLILKRASTFLLTSPLAQQVEKLFSCFPFIFRWGIPIPKTVVSKILAFSR